VRKLSAGIKVGLLFIILIAGAYGVWKTIGERPSGSANFEVWAKFKDASGLPLGSRVVIAGLPIGEVHELSIEGRYARITVRMRSDIELWDNAIIFKKSSSLLGDFFLEIDPGTAEVIDAQGTKRSTKLLEHGDQITRVVEATSPDQLMRRIEETLPKVDSVLLSVRDLSEDVRSIVNGPLASIMSRIDQLVQEEAGTVSSILARTDRSLERIELITKDVRRITQGADKKVDKILKNLAEATADAKDLIHSAKREVEETGAKIREKLDDLDGIFDPTASVMSKIDNDEGTLGRLVNDSTIADNIEDITEDAKDFLGTLFGMQTYVGLRSEYNLGAGQFRHYVTVELATRPDKFYYIELEKGPRGNYPEVKLTWDPALGRFRQDVVIEDKIRFTFQFAKRYDWFTMRYGIKENTGGIGVDGQWFDNRLKVSVDVFDATFDALPRLKVTAAYQLFGFLYVLGGVDEILNPPDSLLIEPINGGTVSGDDIPTQFQEFRFGRDLFFGASLRFNDEDLAALLTVGGAALAGAIQ